MTTTRSHNNHNEYIAPFHDATNKLLIFNMDHYYIADDATREGFFKSLNDAIRDKNYPRIYQVLAQLKPYWIKHKIQSARRQTRLVDSVTRTKIED